MSARYRTLSGRCGATAVLLAALFVTTTSCRSVQPAPTVSRTDSSIAAASTAPADDAVGGAARSQKGVIDAASDDAASAQASASVPVIDTPPWPDGATKLVVTWVVYPAVVRAGRGGDVPTRRIELVVRAGAVARRFATEDRFSIVYATAMQRRCQGPAFDGARVAELYMNGGGNSVFAVDRRAGELVLSHAISTDGRCEPGPCPAPSVTLARIPIPPGVVIEERFHVIDDARHEHDESCVSPEDGP